MKRVLVLGCTGSIGSSTLDIINNMKDDFCVCGVQSHRNQEKLDYFTKLYKCPSLLTSKNNSVNHIFPQEISII